MPYVRPVPALWWLKRRPYTLFIIREATAIFVGLYCLILLALLYALGRGESAYAGMLALLKSGPAIALHAVALVFTLYHSVTWFNLAPKAIVVPMGEGRVPEALIAGANYAAWAVVSGILYWIIARG